MGKLRPMAAPAATRTACPSCDLLVDLRAVREGQRARCPRCGHLLTVHVPNALGRSLALGLAATVFLVLANVFPFLALEANGLEQVMTLPRSAVELYRDGDGVMAVLVLGPIVGIPGAMLTIVIAVAATLKRRRGGAWLVPAGRLLFALAPWSMAEVFLIGVLVSLIKIGSMADVVLGVSFWSYVGFVVCFTATVSSLDRLKTWEEIEACNR